PPHPSQWESWSPVAYVPRSHAYKSPFRPASGRLQRGEVGPSRLVIVTLRTGWGRRAPSRFLWRLLWTMAQEVPKDAGDRSEDGDEPERLEHGLGEADRPGDVWISRQPVPLGTIPVGQHGDHASAADALRIVYRRVGEAVLLELLHARGRDRQHLVLGAKLQATGGASLDAGRLQSDGDPVHAQRALGHLAGLRVEPRDVERTACLAEAAADALLG